MLNRKVINNISVSYAKRDSLRCSQDLGIGLFLDSHGSISHSSIIFLEGPF